MYVIAVLTRLLRKAHALKFSDGSVPAILLYYRSEALPLPMSVVRLSLRPRAVCGRLPVCGHAAPVCGVPVCGVPVGQLTSKACLLHINLASKVSALPPCKRRP